jgi:hypothetical protein
VDAVAEAEDMDWAVGVSTSTSTSTPSLGSTLGVVCACLHSNQARAVPHW